MTRSVQEIFDDVDLVGEDASAPDVRESAVRAVRAVLCRASAERLPPGAPDVVPCEEVVGSFESLTEEDVLGDLLRAEAREGASALPFASASSTDLPVLSALYRRFVSASPPARLVRVEPAESYASFRAAKRVPYLDEYEARLAALEAWAGAHDADGHPSRLAALERAFADHVAKCGEPDEGLVRIRSRAVIGGERIPLSLPPDLAGRVHSWKDGDEVLCTLRSGVGPAARFFTTGTPCESAVAEAVGYADAAGVDPVAVAAVLPALAEVMGGGYLAECLRAAEPVLGARPEVVAGRPFFGRLVTPGDPVAAAATALLQLCDRGDRAACRERDRLARHPRGATLLARAARALAVARRHASRVLRRVL